jgi:hypothetical protein
MEMTVVPALVISTAVKASSSARPKHRLYVRGQRNSHATTLRMRMRPGQSLRRQAPQFELRPRHSAVVSPPPSPPAFDDPNDDGFAWLKDDEDENRTIAGTCLQDFYGGRARVVMDPVEEHKESTRFLRITSSVETRAQLLVRYRTIDEMRPALTEFLSEHPHLVDPNSTPRELVDAHVALARWDLSALWSLYYIALRDHRIRPGGRLLQTLYQRTLSHAPAPAPQPECEKKTTE